VIELLTVTLDLKLIETWSVLAGRDSHATDHSYDWVFRSKCADAHYQRYKTSAELLKFNVASRDQFFDGLRVELGKSLSDLEQTMGTRWVVRVECNSQAECLWSLRVLQPESATMVCLSSLRMHSSHPFLRHKSNHRDIRPVYDQERGRLQRLVPALFDVLVLNEKGEVTEGTRSNLFIRRGQKWQTPPLECGLLGGVERKFFIEELNNNSSVEFKEAIVTPDQLRIADEIILTNSVRGRVSVKWY
jgi:para-aminobenzoate synthetase/4-amino-4-deoxychorismate lyase